MSSGTDRRPPDQDARDLIRSDLDRSLLVEAAAGTGKTTSMVGRMTALLSEGRCTVRNLAAVTFTRKAAAELRTRFQIELEEAVRSGGDSDRRRSRLSAALDNVEGCFIGTIHSFCSRLLRERPVEAGVSVDFAEIEDDDDAQLRSEAWELTAARLIAADDPLLDELRRLGIELRDLSAGFERYADFPDVEEWPAPPTPVPETAPVKAELEDYARRMEALIPTFPLDRGTDQLMNRYCQVARLVRQNDLDDPLELEEILELFLTRMKMVQKYWSDCQKGRSKTGKEELQKWEAFAAECAEPYVKEFRAACYEPILRLFARAGTVYDELRRSAGLLNFQDILLKTAGLLRSGPHVREYFRKRFTHLLVDEFQDTDPVQAEVLLLLTADDPAENDWKRCRPVPGSLFVVGDPKQSIYRFRRADIVMYNEVKEILVASGGRVLSLHTNFRTDSPVVAWVNEVFDKEFPGEADEFSPRQVPLEPWRTARGDGALGGVRVLEIPEEYKVKDGVIAFERDFLARVIGDLVDGGAVIPDPAEPGGERPVRYGDFLIITSKKKHLGLYARALQNMGVPVQVTGGGGLKNVDELELLHRCLAAVSRPHDPVALVAVLRSELFGVSDRTLLAFAGAGGVFSFLEAIPHRLEEDDRKLLGLAFEELTVAHRWLAKLPPAAAAEKIARRLGLLPRAGSATGGDVRAGSLAKVFELLRAGRASAWSAAELTRYVGRILEGDEEHDEISARSEEVSCVRIMNLHKAKGLEAPIVFLADPTGFRKHPVHSHVDRSGRIVRGHLAIFGKASDPAYQGPLLARPAGWDDLERKERQFLDAERKRRMYVAATRAGIQLVVVLRAKGNSQSEWKFFESHLSELGRLDDPGPRCAPEERGADLTAAEVSAASEKIEGRWKILRQPSYEVRLASRAAAGRATPSGGGTSSDGDGARKGTVIHSLLETAMTARGTDLGPLARSLVAEQELDEDFAPVALELVERVAHSGIWTRATSSGRFLTEVPVQVDLSAKSARRPEIAKGVIDLVFDEGDGWVIVDYKTDDRPAGTLGDLVEKYRPQIDLYRAAWERAVKMPVKETGIYFVRADRYEIL